MGTTRIVLLHIVKKFVPVASLASIIAPATSDGTLKATVVDKTHKFQNASWRTFQWGPVVTLPKIITRFLHHLEQDDVFWGRKGKHQMQRGFAVGPPLFSISPALFKTRFIYRKKGGRGDFQPASSKSTLNKINAAHKSLAAPSSLLLKLLPLSSEPDVGGHVSIPRAATMYYNFIYDL